MYEKSPKRNREPQPDYYYRLRDYNMYGYHAFPPPYPLYRPYGRRPSGRYPGPYPQGGLQEWAFSPSRFLAATLIGRRVINESGSYLGKVADLLIDTRDAKIKKIILAACEIFPCYF